MRRLFLLLFFALVLIIFLQTNWFWQFVYPLKYEELILSKAQKYDIDPYLVAAIIYVESRFNPQAKSHKGAIGLMQIMPETGAWIAGQLAVADFNKEFLYQPETNIDFGAWYLADLKKEFNNQLVLVLAAYNAGRGNVSNWLKGDWDGRQENLDQLPYPETRNYVRQVFRIYEIYKKIYNLSIHLLY